MSSNPVVIKPFSIRYVDDQFAVEFEVPPGKSLFNFPCVGGIEGTHSCDLYELRCDNLDSLLITLANLKLATTSQLGFEADWEIEDFRKIPIFVEDIYAIKALNAENDGLTRVGVIITSENLNKYKICWVFSGEDPTDVYYAGRRQVALLTLPEALAKIKLQSLTDSKKADSMCKQVRAALESCK